MATSAESAQTWVKEKEPSEDEILSVIEKLENRIESWTGDSIDIQGSIDAVVYLQSELEVNPNQETESIPVDLSALSTDVKVNLDTSNLIPDVSPIELEAEVKQAAFLALKAQLEKK